jgi:acetyl esterase
MEGGFRWPTLHLLTTLRTVSKSKSGTQNTGGMPERHGSPVSTSPKVGPFLCLLDVHGGVWTNGDRTQNVYLDQQLANSGLCIVAIDFRLAPQHPYPAQVADVNFATRWLKANAPEFNADPHCIGILGTSSGGHTVMLSAMKPFDSLYTTLPLIEASALDATVVWVLALWPVLDPYARYLYAQKAKRDNLVTMTNGYFLTEKAMKEGNPQLILDRGEKVQLPPVLVIQGTSDDNIPLFIPQRFAKSYRTAGGELELELFAGMPHGFARQPGSETQRALEIMKAWLARRLSAQKTGT